jgi:hypothetical protein
MSPHERLHHARIAGIEATLGPYRWRGMTARAVAFRSVEAIEGDLVAADDRPVWIVEQTLAARRWPGLTVAGVARHAAVALDA